MISLATPPVTGSAVGSVIGSVVLAMALSSCALGAGSARPTLPPLTPEPGFSLPADPPDPAGSAGAATPVAPDPGQAPIPAAARRALTRYLRGIGAADTRACVLLAPGYEQTVFGGRGRCRTWVAGVKDRLPAEELLALRTVTVPTGTPGPGAAVTIGFAQLRWRGAPTRQGRVLAERFILRRAGGGRWLISG